MNEKSQDYGKQLFDLTNDGAAVLKCREIISENKSLYEALKNPMVELVEKNEVIEKVFPDLFHDFLKQL